MIVNNTNLVNNGVEAACEISLEDVELETCPAGTALEGVAVPDDGDPNTFPEFCNLSDLDRCIDGTDLAGVFVMDTDNNTVFDTIQPDTVEPVCNLEEAQNAEVCDDGTQLEGILVNNTDAIIDGLEAACNPFELCPTGTALAGVAVLDDGDPNTLPAACSARGLEICPVGTDQVGHFVMGDGDLTTTAELLPFCSLPDAEVEVCASTTDLAGMIVNDTNLANNGLEAACEISPDDVELQTCPAGTALAGVAVNITSPDTTPPDGIPDVCTVSGLEICPVGTDQVGHFVMGDGDLTTTEELLPFCSLPDAEVEVCASTTDLAGMIVNNTNLANNGLEAACEISPDDVELQTCPAGTALAGVAVNITSPDTTPPDGIPDVCTVSGLEICPVGTDQVGHFVMGDGDLTTNAELLPLCNLPDAEVEVCASTTDLAGMIVNNTDLVNNGLEAACEISLDDVELQTCPAGTALAGVAVNITSPDTTPPDGIPDVCTVSGLEICPVGTDQVGHFVMGDGDLTTNAELLPFCSLPDAEVCADGTQLAGILVNNTDLMNDGLEPACNPFEICPADTGTGRCYSV